MRISDWSSDVCSSDLRNFYSVDTRTVPTPAAWQLGWASAERLLLRHRQDEGCWPRRLALSAWGTANMRTGGDDIAQALALMGVKPTWETASRRITGFEILPLSEIGRASGRERDGKYG